MKQPSRLSMALTSNLRTVLAAAGLVALGVWVAPRPTGSPSTTSSTPEQHGSAAPRDGAAPRIDLSALRAEIRAAVHAELGGAPPTPADHPDVDEPVEPRTVERTDQQLAAADLGLVFLDEILARGRLTEDDTRALGPLLAGMQPEDAMNVRLALASAVNSDRLAIDGLITPP